jgi:hypothetical protein
VTELGARVITEPEPAVAPTWRLTELIVLAPEPRSATKSSSSTMELVDRTNLSEMTPPLDAETSNVKFMLSRPGV